MLGAEHAAPVINARSELPLSLSSDTTVPQGTADVNTQGSTEYTPLRMPTLDAEGAANEVKMPVISENAPADRKAAQFDIIRQSNPFDAELGNHTWIKFQSTPPARGATCRSGSAPGQREDFNPRPPRGGRLWRRNSLCRISKFQSTPPARGGDSVPASRSPRSSAFQSTPPARGGRPGRDQSPCSPARHFNPRPPRGGATTQDTPAPPRGGISIHAPREGGRPLRFDYI